MFCNKVINLGSSAGDMRGSKWSDGSCCHRVKMSCHRSMMTCQWDTAVGKQELRYILLADEWLAACLCAFLWLHVIYLYKEEWWCWQERLRGNPTWNVKTSDCQICVHTWKRFSCVLPEKHLVLFCQLISIISLELCCWLAELLTSPLAAEDLCCKQLPLH